MKVNQKASDLNQVLQDKTLSNLNSTKASEVGNKPKVDKNKEVVTQAAKEQSAKVDLSPRAQEMKKAKEIAMSTPDVDSEKVKKFQNLIDKGLYKVDAKKVADKMVDDSLMSSFQEES